MTLSMMYFQRLAVPSVLFYVVESTSNPCCHGSKPISRA
jgi:hypothetical protein